MALWDDQHGRMFGGGSRINCPENNFQDSIVKFPYNLQDIQSVTFLIEIDLTISMVLWTLISLGSSIYQRKKKEGRNTGLGLFGEWFEVRTDKTNIYFRSSICIGGFFFF